MSRGQRSLWRVCHRSETVFGHSRKRSRCFSSVENEVAAVRPLFFQRSPRRCDTRNNGAPLTPYHLLGTASILPPQHRHLSPCLGAALATSPFVGNLMRVGQREPEWEEDGAAENPVASAQLHHLDHNLSTQLSRASFLVNNLFFQMIRESPIHLVRNKSLPASYLNPALVGSLLGHSLGQLPTTSKRHNDNSHKARQQAIRDALKRDFGIRSNHIHGDQWTGISLARWMDLGVVLNDEEVSTTTSAPVQQNLHETLVPALWLTALWGLASSTNDLQEYFLGLGKSGSILLDSQSLGDDFGSFTAQGAPIFSQDDFSTSKLQEAMDRLLHYYSHPFTDDEFRNKNSHHKADAANDSALAAYALELVCASIALNQQSTNAVVPVLPNGYYSFDGGAIRADCVEVAIREIFYLLLWNVTPSGKGFLDLDKLPKTACPRLVELLRAENDSIKVGSNNKNDVDFGKAWFDLLSDRVGCIYLSESPDGKSYELAPTIEGISVALWSLLSSGATKKQQTSTPWRSLRHCSDFWSCHCPEDPLFIEENTLRHKQSNDEVVEHETIVLGRKQVDRAIEIRLRCDWEEACGMAAVTRLSAQQSGHQLDVEQVNQLHKLSASATGRADLRASHDRSLAMLCLALPPWKHGMGILPILATPYGADRRTIWMDSGVNRKKLGNERDQEELMQSQQVLQEQILYACQLCQELPRVGAQILCWVLQESPVVVERSKSLLLRDKSVHFKIEDAILALPTEVLGNESVREAIERNWACQHTTIALKIRQKLGKASLLESFASSLKPSWFG